MVKNSAVILSDAFGRLFTKQKENRLRLSASRIINEYQLERVAIDKKDAAGRKFKRYSKSWTEQKGKILSGRIRGRGGKASKTLRKFRQLVSKLNTPYTATAVDDKMRFTGKLLTKFNIPANKIVFRKQRNNRYIMTFQASADLGGKDSKIEAQLRGLKRKGYDPLGFVGIPKDLRQKLEIAFARILND